MVDHDTCLVLSFLEILFSSSFGENRVSISIARKLINQETVSFLLKSNERCCVFDYEFLRFIHCVYLDSSLEYDMDDSSIVLDALNFSTNILQSVVG